MTPYALVSHYSQALVKLASSKEQLEKHVLQIEEITALLKANLSLQGVLLASSIHREKKKKALQNLLLGKVDNQILHFLFVLIDKDRFKYFLEISEGYQQLAQKNLNKVVVKLITALPVESKIKEKLQNKLEQKYHKKIAIQESIDPTILGGMILMIDNQMIDQSIRSHLKQLKENLLAANI